MLRNKNRAIAIVVVEGAADSRIYRRVLQENDTHIVWLNGKDDALALLEQFNRTKIPGVVAIIDADEHRYLGKKRQGINVCWTSTCDLESMVIASDAYLRFPPSSTTEAVRTSHRDALITAALPIACLRILSKIENLGLDFKEIVFGAFIDSSRIACDVGACCEEVYAKNPQSRLDYSDLFSRVEALKSEISDPLLIVNGHDLCKIAHLCSLRLFRRSLRASTQLFYAISDHFQRSDFESTTTYSELREWEAVNSKYTLTTNETIKNDPNHPATD